MNHRFFIFLSLVSFFIAIELLTSKPLFSQAADKKGKERLAVLDLESTYGVDEGLAEALSIIVRSKLFSFGDYQVMSKSDIMAVASREQLIQALGCDDGTSQCLVNFGRAIGTRFMVAGAISKLGSTYTISLRMLDTKSDSAGVVNLVSESCKCSEDDLIVTAENVAARLVGKYIFSPKKVEAEKTTSDESRKFDGITAKTELEQKIAKENKLTEETEKQRQTLLTDERRKQEEKSLAVEAQRLTLEKEAVEAEAKRIRLDLEEKKKTEVETKKRLTLEKQKAEEFDRQRKEEEQKEIEVETAKRLEEEHRKEEGKRISERAEAERIRLSEEMNSLEEKSAKRLAEKKLAEEKEGRHKAELESQRLATQSEAEKKIEEATGQRIAEFKTHAAAIEAKEGAKAKKESPYYNETISLRKESKGLIGYEKLKAIINTNNFYEKDINPNGIFKSEFVKQNREVVLDKKTSLVWQIDGSSKEMNFHSSKEYIRKLNSSQFGGYSDWRLPTVEELASLMKKSVENSLFTDSIFSTKQAKCWSIDDAQTFSHDSDEKTKWITDFKNGIITRAIWFDTFHNTFIQGAYTANTENFVRAVRTLSEQKIEEGEQQGQTHRKEIAVESKAELIRLDLEEEKKEVEAEKPLDEQQYKMLLTLRKDPKNVTKQDLIGIIKEHNFFEKDINPKGAFRSGYGENGNGTITDRSTGLMWQKSGTVKSMTIYEAQSYLNDLNEQKYCGESDWRLPTLVELASLLRENQVGGLYIDTVFDRTQRKLWSSDVSSAYEGQSGGYDTNYILNLENGSFVRAIFRKFNKPRSQSSDGYLVNDENYARAVRSCK